MTVYEYKDEDVNETKGTKGGDTLEYTKEDIHELPDIIAGVVVAIDETTAGDVFGDKATDQRQELLNILIENKTFNVQMNVPVTKFKKGNVPPKSKLAKIINKSGGLKVGTQVKLTKNEKGYYKIIL
jgi:hypothetical protein